MNWLKENIHFIVSHEMIATYVDENIDDTISLINIDHHHDIAYVDKDIENKIEYLNETSKIIGKVITLVRKI